MDYDTKVLVIKYVLLILVILILALLILSFKFLYTNKVVNPLSVKTKKKAIVKEKDSNIIETSNDLVTDLVDFDGLTTFDITYGDENIDTTALQDSFSNLRKYPKVVILNKDKKLVKQVDSNTVDLNGSFRVLVLTDKPTTIKFKGVTE